VLDSFYFNKGKTMKLLLGSIIMAAAITSFAAEPAKKEVLKEVTNCVKKDKNGKCPPPPNSPKPTPKKVEPK
jgi:hypothetical protein